MKLQPSRPRPPYPYSGSSVLNEPRRELSFEDFVGRTRRFSKEGILHMGCQLLWHLDALADPSPNEENFILRAYGPLIIAVGCLYCARAGRPRPTEVEFRLLCYELHSVRDTISDPVFLKSVEEPEIRRALEAAKSDKLRKIPEGELVRASADAFRARLIELQWRSVFSFPDELERGSLVYEHFRTLVDEIPGNRLREFERSFLRTDPVLFLRAALALYGLAYGSAKRQIADAGFVIVDETKVEPEAESNLEIRHEDLKLVSELLGTAFSSFQELARHVDALPSVLRKYSDEVDRLSSRPAVLLDEYDTARRGKVLLPCPWKFLRAAREFLLFDFFVHLDVNAQGALAGQNAFSLRGEAFHGFLRETFMASPAVVDCDKLKGVSGQHPDFIWAGERYGILIEAKFSLKPNTDRKLVSASSAVVSWDRTCEAIDQADIFLRNLSSVQGLKFDPRQQRKWILLTCTYDSLANESTAFLTPAKRWDFLSGTELTGIGLLAPPELEYLVRERSPDEVGEMFHSIWTEIDPTQMSQRLRDDRLLEAIRRSPRPPRVEAAHKRLLGKVADSLG